MCMQHGKRWLQRVYRQGGELWSFIPPHMLLQADAPGNYFLLSETCSALYTGETCHLSQRFKQHMESVRLHPDQFVHKQIAALGVHKYCMMPVMVEHDQACRKFQETWLLGRVHCVLNSTSTALYLRHHHLAMRCRPDGRPYNRPRGVDLAGTSFPTHTMYSLDEACVSSMMLDGVLQQAWDRGMRSCTVRVQHGTLTLDPMPMRTAKFTGSIMCVEQEVGVVTHVGTWAEVTHQVSMTAVSTLHILDLRREEADPAHSALLQYVLAHRVGCHALHGLALPTLVQLRDVASTFSQAPTRRALHAHLTHAVKLTHKFDWNKRPVVKVRYSPQLHRKALSSWVHDMLWQMPVPTSLRASLVRGAWVVLRSNPTIQQLLCNHIARAQLHDGPHSGTCFCWRHSQLRGDQLHTDPACRSKLVCCRSAQVMRVHPHLAVLGAGAKNVVVPAEDHLHEDLVTELRRFVSEYVSPLWAAGDGGVPPHLLHDVGWWGQLARSFIFPFSQDNPTQFYTTADVNVVKTWCRGLVVGPLDRNSGSLFFICAREYHTLLHKQFIEDSVHYRLLNEEPHVVLARMRAAFMESGLHLFGGWSRMGAMPVGYLLLKDKDLSRCRPVVSCCKHPARTSLRFLARGGTLLVKLVIHLLHFNIMVTSQLADIFGGMDIHSDMWFVTSFDVKQLYTELRHATVEQEVMFFMQLASSKLHSQLFHAYRRSQYRHAFVGMSPNLAQAKQARFADILVGLWYEMDHACFQLGPIVLQQYTGLGIGTFLAPFAAVATMIAREYKWLATMQDTLHRPILGARFMDDLGVAIHTRDLHLLRDMQRTMYPPECDLIQDDSIGWSFSMLESTIAVHPPGGGGVTVVHRNKNARSLLLHGTMHYPRYPHWHSYTPRLIKQTIILGTLHRMVATTSPNAYALLWQPLWLFWAELRILQYPWSIIYRVCRRLNIGKLPVKPPGRRTFDTLWHAMLETLGRRTRG